MIRLHEGYAEETNSDYNYVCRVFALATESKQLTSDCLIGKMKYVNGIGEAVDIQDGDVLSQHGHGTWFALYRKK